MIKVLEVDQWMSTGNVSAFSMEEWESSTTGTLLKVRGGDSDASFNLFGGHAKVLMVKDDASPSMARVWYREENGKLVKWKHYYDSSD